MEITRSRKGINVSEQKYVLASLKKIWMLGFKATNSLTKLGLGKIQLPIEKGRYQQLIGKFIYSMLDLIFVFFLSVVSPFMNRSTKDHLDANKKLRYPKQGLSSKRQLTQV